MFETNGILFYHQWSGISLKDTLNYYLNNKHIHTVFFNGMNEFELGWYLVMDDTNVKTFNREVKKRRTKVIYVVGSNDGVHNFYNKTMTVFDANTIIYHFSTFFLRNTYFIMKNVNPNYVKTGIYKYENMNKLFISLNNKAHNHRCKMMDNFFKNDLDKEGYLTWMEPETNYNFKYWIPEKLILEDDYDRHKDSYRTIPDEMFTTFISVVSESTMNVPFITEKTIIPIILEKPVLIWGCPEINKELSRMGFLLFDEIFDYSFDSEIDDDKRLDGLMQNLINLKNEDFSKLREKIEYKLIYNKNHLKKISENREMIPDILVKYAKISNKSDDSFMDLTVDYHKLDTIPLFKEYDVTIRDKSFFLP